jgi:hypothetical protein
MVPDNVEFATIGPGTEVAISPKQREKSLIQKTEVCLSFSRQNLFSAICQ